MDDNIARHASFLKQRPCKIYKMLAAVSAVGSCGQGWYQENQPSTAFWATVQLQLRGAKTSF